PSPSGRDLAEAGLVAPPWPEPWGRGADPVHQLIIDDELARARVRRPVNPIGIGWAGPTILLAGTPEQKESYLLRLLAGEDLWCQLFSEPGVGSDLASLTTRAVRDGDEWVVTGQKIWTSLAQFARYGILIARTDPDVPKHKGITYFLIDMEQPGVDVRPLREMTGEAAFNEVFFSEARVPDANRLGGLGEGWRVAMTTLANERDPGNPGVASGGGSVIGRPDLQVTVAEYRRQQAAGSDAMSLAIAGGIAEVLDRLAARFDRRDDAVMRQRRAAIASSRLTQRWTTQRAKANARAGQAPGPETSTLKLGGSALGRSVRDAGLALMGPHGMLLGDDAPEGGLFHKYALFV
ncbi:MAG TPA: acyl-CoA dehydrogenase family protein, partial [Actinomycetota bacterium]|nr:acyl-CoA dehydrogenase family protein [Actinomycetota bacterium]